MVLAAISYPRLHRLATPIQAASVQPGQVTDLIQQTVIGGLASAGQYIVPSLRLVAQTASSPGDQSVNALDVMSWHAFELLVGEAYRLQGYRVSEIGDGPDGGVDLALAKGGEKFFVQCKQWNVYKAGVDVAREPYGVIAAKGATGGFVVASGRVTGNAKAFVADHNIQLVDDTKLFAMIKQAKPALSQRAKIVRTTCGHRTNENQTRDGHFVSTLRLRHGCAHCTPGQMLSGDAQAIILPAHSPCPMSEKSRIACKSIA